MRKTASVLLASSVIELFPDVLLICGGESGLGFYFDFVFSQPFHKDLFEIIELRMHALKEKEIKSVSMMRENAHAFFLHHKQPLQADKALENEQNIIEMAEMNGRPILVELEHPVSVGAFKLLEVSHPYEVEMSWGSKPVTRIEGVVFEDKYSLKEFIKAFTKYKKIDHRIKGPELGFFQKIETFSRQDYFWLPKGESLRESILNFWRREIEKWNLSRIKSPLVSDNFSDDLRSSLLPAHLQLINDHLTNNANLSHYLVEVGDVFREVKQEEEWGLFNASYTTKDQLTLLCNKEEATKFLISSLQFITKMVRILAFESHWCLSMPMFSKPNCVESCKKVLSELGIEYVEQKKDISGPKIELLFCDQLGREWPGPSIEMIEKLKSPNALTEYLSKRGLVIFSASLLGSVELIAGLMIEAQKTECRFE